MFSPLQAHNFHYNQQVQHYTPHVPSPLSSSPLRRSPSSSPPGPSTNIFALRDRDANMISASPTRAAKTPPSAKMDSSALISPPQTSGSRFSKRATKPNPLMAKGMGDEGRETRRRLFLKRVREESEEKKWKERMGRDNNVGEEELLRSLWVGEERRREEGRRREAMRLGLDHVVVEDEMDEIMVQAASIGEEAELEALLSQEESLQQQQDIPEDVLSWEIHTKKEEERPETETLYGSDDEEYDHIFMDFVESEFRTATQQPLPEYVEDQDMMDMS